MSDVTWLALITAGGLMGFAARAFWSCWQDRPPVVRDVDGRWKSARVWRRPK